MSYNRGQFLENLIESIDSLFRFEYDLTIYDDGSDDPYTLHLLQTKYKRYTVKNDFVENELNSKHKGLYSNMNNALQYSYNNGIDYLMIFQDDTQVIRSVDELEIKRYENIFQSENIAQLVCTFFKKNHQKPYTSLLEYDSKTDAFFPKKGNRDYMLGIADMGIYHVRKLRRVDWFFENDESQNQIKGRKLLLNRSALRVPFLAFLPWPSVYRFKGNWLRKNYARFSDWYFNTGFHPLEYLSEFDKKKIMDDQSELILFEDDILKTKYGITLTQPWNFYQATFEWKRRVKSLLKLKQHNNQ